MMTEEHTATKVRARRWTRWLGLALAAASGLIAVAPALAVSPAVATTSSPPGDSGVVTRSLGAGGTMFYDPNTHIAAVVNFTAETWCDPAAPGFVDLKGTSVKDQSWSVSGTNVPVYLYRTSSPIVDFANWEADCAAGAFITPAIATGTVTVRYSNQTTSGMWEQLASGTIVNAASGKKCQFNALGSGPFTLVPYSFDLTATINTHGC